MDGQSTIWTLAGCSSREGVLNHNPLNLIRIMRRRKPRDARLANAEARFLFGGDGMELIVNGSVRSETAESVTALLEEMGIGAGRCLVLTMK